MMSRLELEVLANTVGWRSAARLQLFLSNLQAQLFELSTELGPVRMLAQRDQLADVDEELTP